MFLMVCGCPRSGTTEIGWFLNKHGDVALGSERYIYRYVDSVRPVTPADFEPSRFNLLREGETFWSTLDDMQGWSRNGVCEPVRDKIGRTRIFGDKVPDQVFHFDKTLTAFAPDAKAVVCVRDVLSVMRSWQARADNVEDHLWQRSEGAEAALRQWTGAMASLLRHQASGQPVADVFVPDFYREDRREALRLLGFLQLEFDKGVEGAFYAALDWRRKNPQVSAESGKQPTDKERELILRHPYVHTAIQQMREAGYRISPDRLFWDGFEAQLATAVETNARPTSL